MKQMMQKTKSLLAQADWERFPKWQKAGKGSRGGIMETHCSESKGR